jgi:hypothetical protein
VQLLIIIIGQIEIASVFLCYYGLPTKQCY